MSIIQTCKCVCQFAKKASLRQRKNLDSGHACTVDIDLKKDLIKSLTNSLR